MRIGLGKPLLLVLLVALPVFLNLYQVHVAVLILLFGIVSIGLSLVMGFGGQVNLAQAAFFGTGAYLSAILTTVYGWNPWLTAPAAILGTCAVALVAGIPALRVQSHYLGIVSLGLALAFASMLTNATITGGASGLSKIPPLPLPGIDLTDEYNYYYLVLLALIAVVAFSLFIAGTTLGHRFRAMRDDNLAAAAAGIEIPYYRLMAFLLAGLLCGVAGVLYAHLVRYVSPDTFGLPTMFLLLAMVIVGGQDSIWGAAARRCAPDGGTQPSHRHPDLPAADLRRADRCNGRLCTAWARAAPRPTPGAVSLSPGRQFPSRSADSVRRRLLTQGSPPNCVRPTVEGVLVSRSMRSRCISGGCMR